MVNVPSSGSEHWVPASGPPRTVKDGVFDSAIALSSSPARRGDGTLYGASF